MLRVQRVCLCVYMCTHVFAYCMYTRVATCCTIQSHASASVTQVYINRFTSPVHPRDEQHVIISTHTGNFVRI